MGEVVRSDWVVDPENPNMMIRREQNRYFSFIFMFLIPLVQSVTHAGWWLDKEIVLLGTCHKPRH